MADKRGRLFRQRGDASPAWLRRVLVGVLIAIVLLVVVPVAYVWIPFLVVTARCGHQPVIASNFASSYSYVEPGDPGYGPSLLDTPDHYFCTSAEAEAHGYRRIPYPHS